AAPTTRVVRGRPAAEVQPIEEETDEMTRTKLVRGNQQVERGAFAQDPVVGWRVIVGGPGIGSYRPVFEGNNTIGRGAANRIPIDFGDDTIS
ncbi:FHA domain-containing protein, partial [Enterococcus hirae]